MLLVSLGRRRFVSIMVRQNRLLLVLVASGFCYGQRWMALQDDGVNYLQEAKEMLEKIAPRNAGGIGSWSEVDAISRAFAKALATDPMSMENMYALLTFLLLVPENARMGMAEAAVKVLMDAGLEDSASCLLGNMASVGPQDSPTTEIFYEKSLEIKMNNPVTVRSFGFALQRQGRTEDALRLYDNQLLRIPDQPALYLTRASLCPHLFESAEATRLWYTKLWGELDAVVETLHRLEHPQVEDVHVSLQQLPSVGWQYLGFPVGPLVRTMNDAIHILDPELKRVAPRLHPLHCWAGKESKSARTTTLARDGDDGDHVWDTGASNRSRRTRIGIVMERRGNASPERVFAGVLQKINKRHFEVVVFAQDTPQSPPGVAIIAAADRVVFLPGHDGLASIGEPTHVGGGGVVSMGMPSLHDSRRVIEAEKLDCILYLAMGSSLLQQLLSIGRLAPLQLSFGLGHPITSGHVAVDYFVSSDLFEAAGEAGRREGTVKQNDRVNSTTQFPLVVEDLKHRVYDDFPEGIPNTTLHAVGRGEGNGEMYTEQLVLFDTLTGVFQPPQRPNFARVEATRESLVKCAQIPSVPGELETLLQSRTLNGTQQDASECRLKANMDNKDEAEYDLYLERNLRDEKEQDTIHLYHCLQDFKKFHPAFDVVLHGILERDPRARILLPAAAKVHLQRWKRTLVGGVKKSVDAAEVAPRGGIIDRLIFLPEMEHPDMMEVVAACDVMLAPWGWGAGITAFEALALGLPVVTAPNQESVLHFSRGQITLLGLEEELIASDAEDYVAKAVRLATDKAFRGRVSTRILEQDGRLFGDATASEVAREWESFIERSVKMGCQRL